MKRVTTKSKNKERLGQLMDHKCNQNSNDYPSKVLMSYVSVWRYCHDFHILNNQGGLFDLLVYKPKKPKLKS